MKFRRIVSGLLATILLFVVAACGNTQSPGTGSAGQGEERTEIRVGMTVSTTGDFAFASEQGFKGVQIWVDDVNRQGGLYVESLGKRLPVNLIYLEDRSDKQQVTRLYEKLITEDKIDIAIAPFGSTLTAAAAAVTERYNMPLVIWSGSADSIYDQGYKYVISGSQIPASQMPRPHVEHIAHMGVKKLAIVYLDESYPTVQAEGVRAFAEELGVEVVHYEKFGKDTLGFGTLLTKVEQSGAEALYVSAYMEEQANILRQLKEMNLMFPYLFLLYSGQPEWRDLTGQDGMLVFGHTIFHPDLQWDVTDGLTVAEMMARDKELFPDAKNPIDFQSALAYGASVMLGKMVETADSLSADDIRKAAGDLSGKVTVLTGPYVLDEAGRQHGMHFSVTQLVEKNGQPELNLVWPADVANAEPIYPLPHWSER